MEENACQRCLSNKGLPVYCHLVSFNALFFHSVLVNVRNVWEYVFVSAEEQNSKTTRVSPSCKHKPVYPVSRPDRDNRIVFLVAITLILTCRGQHWLAGVLKLNIVYISINMIKIDHYCVYLLFAVIMYFCRGELCGAKKTDPVI